MSSSLLVRFLTIVVDGSKVIYKRTKYDTWSGIAVGPVPSKLDLERLIDESTQGSAIPPKFIFGKRKTKVFQLFPRNMRKPS